MKTFFILALLAVVCAADQYDGYIDPVHVVEAADLGYIPDDNLRVNFVDSPYADEEAGFEPLAPSELEVPLLPNGIPQNDDAAYPYRPLADPTWR